MDKWEFLLSTLAQCVVILITFYIWGGESFRKIEYMVIAVLIYTVINCFISYKNYFQLLIVYLILICVLTAMEFLIK